MADACPAMSLKMARELLGISSLSTPAEIRRAFRKAAKLAHPDSGGDPGAFQQVTEAFELLQSPEDLPSRGEPEAPPPADRLSIPPRMALLGGVVDHDTPDGRTLRVTLPAGLRTGDKVRAGPAQLTIYVRAEDGVLARGHDLWMTVKVAPATLRKGGRVGLETPLGRRIVWITRKDAERGLVRLEGQGLPPRGKHPKGHMFLRLAGATEISDSAALALLRRFTAAWAA